MVFWTGGGGEIRTLEGLPPGGFQDHCTRPTMRLLHKIDFLVRLHFSIFLFLKQTATKMVCHMTIRTEELKVRHCIFPASKSFLLVMNLEYCIIFLPASRADSTVLFCNFLLERGSLSGFIVKALTCVFYS